MQRLGLNLDQMIMPHERGASQRDDDIVQTKCAEIPLESSELCLLVETFPQRCTGPDGRFDEKVYYRTLELATIYASSMTLMPTHNEDTNAVVAKNHRIGVSMSGIADWMSDHAATSIITWLDRGYQRVRQMNTHLAKEAGIRESVRVTTVKPSTGGVQERSCMENYVNSGNVA